MIILEDIKEMADRLHTSFWHRYRQIKQENAIWQLDAQGANFSLDSNGNGTFPVWENKTGRTALIGRMVVNCDTYTPQSVYTSGYAYFFKGPLFSFANMLDFLPNAPGEQIFPNLAEYSGRNCLPIRKNDTLYCQVVSGPASKNVSVFIYGELVPDLILAKDGV